VHEFVPSPGQGCVAVECRSDDPSSIDVLRAVDHPATRHAVQIERAFLAELGSGCSMPVGAHVDGSKLHAFLASEDRSRHRREVLDLDDDVAVAVDQARRLAATMRAALV
jgi:hydroxymethylbilane synthase